MVKKSKENFSEVLNMAIEKQQDKILYIEMEKHELIGRIEDQQEEISLLEEEKEELKKKLEEQIKETDKEKNQKNNYCGLLIFIILVALITLIRFLINR